MITSTSSSRSMRGPDGFTAEDILLNALEGSEAYGVSLTENPTLADVIVFAESHRNNNAIRDILQHETYRRHSAKSIVHSGMDYPEPWIPGLYPSIDHRWAKVLCCEGSPYLVAVNRYVGSVNISDEDVDVLASFTGSCKNKPVRIELLKASIEQNWSDILITDTGAEFIRSKRSGDTASHDRLKRVFAEDLQRSRFVLCPAGAGPSSFRIFEAMKSRRVPVVISDSWTPPQGPDWQEFIIRVPERQIKELPGILQDYSSTWRERGQLAHDAWKQFFDPISFGAHIIERAVAVKERSLMESRRRYVAAFLYNFGPRKWIFFRQRMNRRLKRSDTV